MHTHLTLKTKTIQRFFLFLGIFLILCVQQTYSKEILLDSQRNGFDSYIQGQAHMAVPGVAGKAVRLNTGTVVYPALDSIQALQGTVAFWIKPVNWSSDSVREKFIPIFAIDRGQGKNWPLLLYFFNKGNGSKMLSLRSRVGGTFSDTKTMIAEAGLQKGQLTQNTWTYVALTWDGLGLNLYIDGKKIATRSYGMELNMRPIDKQDKIWIMPTDFWGHKDLEGWNTDIDSLKIFSHAMTDDAINELYGQQKQIDSDNFRPCILTAPSMTNKVIIDGQILVREWQDASCFPLTKMNKSRTTSSAWDANVYVKHDKDNLYVAYDVKSNKKNPATTNKGELDKKVFLEDHIEFLCRMPGSPIPQYFQLAIAPNGAYAGRQADGSWDKSFKFEHQTSESESGWQVEVKIPLSALGIKLEDTKNIFANFGLHRTDSSIDDRFNRWFSWSTADAQGADGAFFQTMGQLILSGEAMALRIEKLYGLDYGKLETQLSSPLQSKVNWKIVLKDIATGKEISKDLTNSSGLLSYNEKATWKGMTGLTITGLSQSDNSEIMRYETLYYIKDPWNFTSMFTARQKTIDIVIDSSGLESALKDAFKEGLVSASISLQRCSDNKIICQKEIPVTSTKINTSLATEDLSVGEYILKTTLHIPGKDLVKTQSIEKPSDIFLKDRKGLDSTIPAPWTSLHQDGNSISTKYHKYQFGKTPFPDKAWGYNTEVMSACEGLRCVTDKGDQGFIQVGEVIQKNELNKIITTGTAQLDDTQKLLMHWERTVNYDGMIRYDITLEPVGAPVKIKKIYLKFDIPEKQATYALTSRFQEQWSKLKTGAISAFPLIWLTGSKAGFCLFTDNDANWVFGKTDPLKMVKGLNQASLMAEIINKPVVIERKISYVLGIMSTPARPPRKDFRNIHFEGWGRFPLQTLQSRGWSNDRNRIQWKRSWLPTENWNPEATRKSLAEYREKGIGCVQYSMTGIPDNNPIFDYYGDSWRNRVDGFLIPKHTPLKDNDGTPYYFCAATSPNNIDYSDFSAYYVDKMLKDFDFEGYYIDGSGCGRTDAPYKNTNLEDNFLKRKYVRNYDIFGRRDLSERLYKIIHSHKPDGFLVGHSWDNIWPPLVGFYDLGYPGEEFMHSFPNNHNTYIEDTPLEKWQSNYNSSTMGIALQFLPQLRFIPKLSSLTGEQRFEISRSMWLCCLLHDVSVSGGFYPGVEFIWPIMDEHKVAEADFHGYWEQDKITSNNKDVKVSYYQWPNTEKKLLIIGNISKKNQDVTINFSSDITPPAYGIDQLSDLKSLNPPVPNEVNVKNPVNNKSDKKKQIDLRSPLTLPAYGFKIIAVSFENEKQ